MADEKDLMIMHTCADGVRRMFIAPLTLEQLEALDTVDPEKDGWLMIGLAPTDGSTPPGFSTDCGQIVVPPGTVPPAPSWNAVALNASRPKLMNNTYFEWPIPTSMVTIGAGAVYTGITLGSHPDYLSLVGTSTGVKVYGNVPNNVSADIQITLIAGESYTAGDLSTGASTPISVTLQFAAGDFYANYQYEAPTKTAYTRIGPDGGPGNVPYVTYTAPDGTVIPRQLMTPFGIGAVDGYPYYYLSPISNPMDGIWTAKFEFLGKTKYGTFTLAGVQKPYTGIGLTDSPSAPPPTVVPKITAIDWSWLFTTKQANTNGTQTTVYTYLGNYTVYVNASNGATPELWVNSSFDGVTNPGYQKFAMRALTADAKGYTHSFSVNSAANVKTLFKIKMVGEDDNKFIYFELTMPAPPAASTSRVQIYPTSDNSGGGGGGGGGGSTSDLTTPVTFSGTKSGGYRSTNPNLLDMGYSFTNGRLRNLFNIANPGVDQGKALRYLINDRWYAHDRDAKKWYRVDTNNNVSGTATNLSFNPELGVLVQCFMVELSRKMNGTSEFDKGWRDDGVYNASQLLRVQ